MTHNTGNLRIADSVYFLLNYRESLLQVRQQVQPEDEKGKRKVWTYSQTPCAKPAGKEHWEAPPNGWTKLNVDGSFIEQIGEAGVGLIIKNHQGEVLSTA